jgi:hypothetical protein
MSIKARLITIQATIFVIAELHHLSPPSARALLCASALEDVCADLRVSALDGLFPFDREETLPSCVAHALMTKLFDRSMKVRKRSAALLLAWGADRIVRTMAVDDVTTILCFALQLPDIAKLLVAILQGAQCLFWITHLNLLHDCNYSSFLKENGAILHKLVFCCNANSSNLNEIEVDLGNSNFE